MISRAAEQAETRARAEGREFCGACGQGCATCRLREENPPARLSAWERLDIEHAGGPPPMCM